MKLAVKRKIYYISVVTALVTILVCAVIINRTLVNTSDDGLSDISIETAVQNEEQSEND